MTNRTHRHESNRFSLVNFGFGILGVAVAIGMAISPYTPYGAFGTLVLAIVLLSFSAVLVADCFCPILEDR